MSESEATSKYESDVDLTCNSGIIRSRLKNVHIPDDISSPEFVLRKATEYGERPAFIDELSGRTLTYTEFVRDCYKMAAGLYNHGLRKGDVFAVHLDNCLEYPIITHAVMLCGGIVAGLITELLDHEQLPVIINANPRYIITAPHNVSQIRRLLEHCPKFEVMMVNGDSPDYISYSQILDNDLPMPKVKINPRTDAGFLTCTSGTTGDRKGVLCPQWSLMAACAQQEQVREIAFYDKGTDITLMVRPITHIYCQTCYTTLGPYFGSTCVINKDNSIKGILKAIEKYKVTFLAMTPLPIAQMAKYSGDEVYDTSSLRRTFTAGAPLSDSVRRSFIEKYNIREFMQGYGMSEILFTNITPRSYNGTSCGQLAPNCIAQVVDETTQEPLGPGMTGEIWATGPSRFLFYLSNPKATEETITGQGMVKTGDIGYYDEEQNFYIVDRLKEIIDVDAAKVPPAEVESLLLDHHDILEVGVVGYPDPDYGELPRAYVVRRPGSSITEHQVAQLIVGRAHESRYLRGGVVFVNELPKSTLGKILRKKLKAYMLSEMEK